MEFSSTNVKIFKIFFSGMVNFLQSNIFIIFCLGKCILVVSDLEVNERRGGLGISEFIIFFSALASPSSVSGTL